MFLIKDRRLGMDRYVFLQTDPRGEGYNGEVIEGTSIDYDVNGVHLWPIGHARPDPQLGRDPENQKHYKVFKSPEELRAEGFEFIDSNTPFFAYSWSDYRKRYYPIPDEFAKTMTQEEWFDFLDEADYAMKIRKKQSELAEPKPGASTDQIAEWVAKRHMGADSSIQQVWFLRADSPPDEIRLLEVSEQSSEEGEKIEPVDFVLAVADVKLKLFVADVTPGQIEKVKNDPAKWLPTGWKVDGSTIWGRRGHRQ